MRSTDRARARSRASAMLPLAVLGLGSVSVVLLLLSDGLRVQALSRADARLEAIAEIEKNLATSHLWVEEYVMGELVDLQPIYDDLDWSIAMTDELLGGPRASGGLALSPREVEALSIATSLREHIVRFRRLSAERHSGYDNGRDVETGSPVDIRYDELFAWALDDVSSLRSNLALARAQTADRSRQLFLAILVAWVAVVAGVAFALWRHEQERAATADELEASRLDLAESQKMDAIGRLAGGIAHDVNNYLAAIRGHCELVRLKGAADPEATLHRMDLVLGTVDRTSGLLDRLLAVSRRRPASRELIDLGELLREMDRIIRPAVGEAIEVVVTVDPAPVVVDADPAQIEQVILNLVVNARDAMPSGGRLDLGATRRGPSAVLTVGDSGVGIPPEIRDRIFEPFLSSKADDHSGLGLSVVYGAAVANGGRIEVESEEGAGTTFTVFIPAVDDGVVARRAVAETQDDEALRGSETIVLVDDNADYLEVTRGLLEAFGYDVLSAESAEAAIELCQSRVGAVDLVLTDLVMPTMQGDELAALVGERWGIPAVISSGRASAREATPGAIPKLVPPESLARAVREALDALDDPEPEQALTERPAP